jgi:hypothetical protein
MKAACPKPGARLVLDTSSEALRERDAVRELAPRCGCRRIPTIGALAAYARFSPT